MQKKITVQLLPSEAADHKLIHQFISRALDIKETSLTGFKVLRQSLDARSRTIKINLTLLAFIDEPFQETELLPLQLRDVHQAERKAIVIGAGPAGLFAALRLIELNIRPIILERGKDVRARRRDLAAINKEGDVNPESNYCFGEGGAGTYSDGKLYTRSTKRGDVNRILHILVHFGADPKILYEAHPHIGTNKLPQIITALREQIIACGGEVLFDHKVIDLVIEKNQVKRVKVAGHPDFEGDAIVLATGHSARDIFMLLHSKKINIEAKPFALGVRAEHPQHLIDNIQYHQQSRDSLLPPASYSLVQQVAGNGVFSFCMCPGGIIAPASTENNELVVNGWSPSKRNNPFANSGIVVAVNAQHLKKFEKYGALAGLYFQQSVEQKAWQAGGGHLVAPALRMTDFCNNKVSVDLPSCSYLPGIHPADLSTVLPPYIYTSLQEAFKEFGKKMKGYYTSDAVVVATESRTSSPVRIPRTEKLHHPQLENLYPCAEGAGYAGGIMSAAMDGERIAEAIAKKYAVNIS